MKLVKSQIITICSMFVFALNVQAQDCTELYKRANSLRESGKYDDAITYYQRAKSCDKYLEKDCDKWIKYCRENLEKQNMLDISEQEIHIPYQGGDKEIDVKANGKWNVEGTTDWCSTNAYSKKNFIVQCREPNNSTREKITTLLVKSGSVYKSLKVVQDARPEYIEVNATSLNFPAKGTSDDLKVESNANWAVSSAPSWCQVEKREDGIHIIVSPNDRVLERNDDIVIVSPTKSVTIRISQGAGEEHLTLSQNNLVFNGEGDVHYMRVYTDAANWFVGDYPTWMNVQRIGADSIRIECAKNLPNGYSREGSVQVRTERQTTGVMITQLPRKAQDLTFPDTKIVGGRNISFGVSASYYMPFVGTSAGGDYVGSVLDYGLGNSKESASYKAAFGYSVGAFADMRIYKNIFFTAGVNFTQIKYKNEFNQKTTLTIPFSTYEFLRGEVQNAYTEDYSHTMIEVPLIASYRFKVNNVSHVQLNMGPVLNFGLSAKMKFAGNTDSETMHKYSSYTGQQVDNGNYLRHNAVGTEFNLFQPCVYWEEMFTTGNDAAAPHHDVFQSSPLKKFNCGLRLGVAYEWAGISVGLSYTCMLNNMANKNYWENERWTVLNNSDQTMKGYKQRINTLELKLAYTLRYLGYKSKK